MVQLKNARLQLELLVENAGIMLLAEVMKMALGRKGKEMRAFIRRVNAFELNRFWTYRKTGRVNVRFTF